jgi:YggT family protein
VALGYIFWAYTWVLIARAVVSWVNADPRNAVVRFLHTATDPLLRVVGRMLPSNLRSFPIDIAFLVLFAIVLFLQFALAQTLVDLGSRLRRPVVAHRAAAGARLLMEAA